MVEARLHTTRKLTIDEALRNSVVWRAYVAPCRPRSTISDVEMKMTGFFRPVVAYLLASTLHLV
jgi:hypothetical protein